MLDGVYRPGADGTPEFVAGPAPTDGSTYMADNDSGSDEHQQCDCGSAPSLTSECITFICTETNESQHQLQVRGRVEAALLVQRQGRGGAIAGPAS